MSDIIVAPFSNSVIRDWQPEHVSKMISLLLDTPQVTGLIRVIGTPGQRLGACEIVRFHPSDRVFNDCGRMPWPAVVGSLRDAACVIGNNSGIAHLAGALGTPTVCVFGGSHQRLEWRPRGQNVVVVSRVIGCSPCHLDHGHSSPYSKACLRDIQPAEVRDAVVMIMARAQNLRREQLKSAST